LPWGELHKVFDLFGYDRLHTIDQVRVLGDPVSVCVGVFVRTLERITAQMEDLRDSQLHKRLRPALHGFCPLLHEDNFPVVKTNRQNIAVVADIKKLMRGLSLNFSH
jgi:hypothetical protein